MAAKNTDWFGKISGTLKSDREHHQFDRQQRADAGRLPLDQNIILSEREVKGFWDVNRVLLTTLGGQPRPITTNDLSTFRRNMNTAQKALGFHKGITAKQVINLASSRALFYKNPKVKGIRSDLDKAKLEIRQCLPFAAHNGNFKFITNASGEHDATRHVVSVNFLAYEAAAAKIASRNVKDGYGQFEKTARWMMNQPLEFDCDCGRHRYFFRYVATIGGFAAGRKETGFPKIRNPGLQGVACKHVLRVMAEIERGGMVQRFVADHLKKTDQYKANTLMTQKQAREFAKKAEKMGAADINPAMLSKAKGILRGMKNSLSTAAAAKPARPSPSSKPQGGLKGIFNTIKAKFAVSKSRLMRLFGK